MTRGSYDHAVAHVLFGKEAVDGLLGEEEARPLSPFVFGKQWC